MAGTPSTAWLRPDLGLTFTEFDLEAQRQLFIGVQVLPIFNVSRQTANFTTIAIEALLVDRELKRASGGSYRRQDWEFGQSNYSTEEYGAEELIDDRDKAIYAYAIDLETISARRAMSVVARGLERRIADAVFNTTTFTGALTNALTNEWDDATNAAPIDDVKTAKLAVADRTGIWPETLILSRRVFENLRLCNQIIDWIKYSGRDDPKVGRIGADVIAAALGIERILVGGAYRNSAKKGAAASLSPIWSNEYAMVCKLATSQDLQEPCLGRTFHWTGDGSTETGTVDMYREEQKRADVVRVRQETDELVLYADLGQLLSNVTT